MSRDRGGGAFRLKEWQAAFERAWRCDPDVLAAVADFQGLIRDRYPDATFSTVVGAEPIGVYLSVEADVDEAESVFDTIMDRLLQAQVEEGLPVYVIGLRRN